MFKDYNQQQELEQLILEGDKFIPAMNKAGGTGLRHDFLNWLETLRLAGMTAELIYKTHVTLLERKINDLESKAEVTSAGAEQVTEGGNTPPPVTEVKPTAIDRLRDKAREGKAK